MHDKVNIMSRLLKGVAVVGDHGKPQQEPETLPSAGIRWNNRFIAYDLSVWHLKEPFNPLSRAIIDN